MDFIGVRRRPGDRSSNWRRAAHVNSIVLVIVTIILISCLIASITQTGGLVKSFMFHEGTCDGGSASKTNVALHLLLNVVSTAIFASSNFFMQVLNSPSRHEVDLVHAKGSYLGIGVPSVRNTFKVSRFKTCCWIVLLLSSIPMHLLFNSMIFQTDQRSSDFHLTIASSGFVEGEAYYIPGASLSPAGIRKLGGDNTFMGAFTGYGAAQKWVDYSNSSSPAVKNITAAAAAGASWAKISWVDCFKEYFDCDGLRSHRDVIVVADQPKGWVRDEVWNLAPNETEYWDSIVPGNAPNSLWFSTQCAMKVRYSNAGGAECSNDCKYALASYAIDNPYEYDFASFENMSAWNIDFFRQEFDYVNSIQARSIQPSNTSGLVPGGGKILVDYCLVEPVERVCYVGLSNTLLLAVTICVAVKTATAIIVTFVLGRQNQIPLVTLGDAIASFIQNPDNTTYGMCTVNQKDMRRATRSSHQKVLTGPQRWLGKVHRRWSVVPKGVWVFSYLLFAVGILILAIFTDQAISSRGVSGSIIESQPNAIIEGIIWTFTAGVLVANSPQLLLSFCYLAYNNLFTRLQMAKEWSQFSSGYRPLRVTDPKGKQYSTYRLQLPYKYSIPLILCSILLHWMLSNTLYLFISQGGYFSDLQFDLFDPSLPDRTVLTVGFSSAALVTMLVLSLALIFVPVLLSMRKLPEGITNVGSNSMAISAACHVSPLSRLGDDSSPRDSQALPSRFETLPPPSSPGVTHSNEEGDVIRSNREYGFLSNDGGDVEMHTLMGGKGSRPTMDTHSSTEALNKESLLERVSETELRWGVVQMPPEFYTEFENMGERTYGHLSFGVKEDAVTSPLHGKWYA
ncbi:hypothetical protein JX266_004027 [Neoarthrinium moseri]|nr:hypothetical protein JX266_004027 [Neoarthrinium moseri]